MVKEIVLDRLVYKIRQLEKFNTFYQPGDNIYPAKSELIIAIDDEDIESRKNFLHLLKDINTEVKRIQTDIGKIDLSS